MDAGRTSSSKGFLAGAAMVAALGVLYVSGYFAARASHVLVHFEWWDSLDGNVHRVDVGEGSERLGAVKIVYEPMIIIEERFWALHHPR